MDDKLLVQSREKVAERQRLQHVLSPALARAEPFGSRIVVNSDCGVFPQCSGMHLSAHALMEQTARPAVALLGASCHDGRELEQAERIGVDYTVVGPVKATPSHPGRDPLGWERFETLARDRPMPVYAIGGLTHADLQEA